MDISINKQYNSQQTNSYKINTIVEDQSYDFLGFVLIDFFPIVWPTVWPKKLVA